MEKRKVDVMVLIKTYNHVKWLAETLNSVVNQKTQYSYVAVVHDDASSDGTEQILKEYEKKYPDKVIAMYENVNQRHTGNMVNIRMLDFVECKYVAICEGDDYWVDDHKLEKQINYLESHPECTFCFTNGIVVDVNSKPIMPFFRSYWWKDESILKKLKLKEADFDVEEMILLDFVPTASNVCRYSAYSDYLNFPIPLDLAWRLVCTEKGYAHYIAEKTCAYRIGNQASASGKAGSSFEKYIDSFYRKHCAIYDFFDERTEKKYSNTINIIKNRIYLVCLLTFDKYSEAKKNPLFNDLRTIHKIKIFVKQHFRLMYQFAIRVRNNYMMK